MRARLARATGYNSRMGNFAGPVLALAFALLTACGQKGPLVLPDAKKHKPVVTNPVAPPTATPTPTPGAAAPATAVPAKDAPPRDTAATP